MDQFYKKSFYFDETRERAISIEWNRGFKEVYLSDGGEEFHQVKTSKKLLDGITVETPKGENLYIRLHKNPARWEVLLGNRYLINSYNFAKDSLKSTSNLFYVIFGFSLAFIVLQILMAYEMFGSSIFAPDIIFGPKLLVTYLFIIAFFLSAFFLRKGKTLWYFVGAGLYIIDTLILLASFASDDGRSGIAINIGFIIRIVIMYYIIKAFKHVVNLRKHQKEIAKKTDAELLDI